MQLKIYLEPRTVCGCSFDVVNRGERSKGGGTAPRLWRRLSSPTLSSLEKKESGPRRALALFSGRHLLVEILKFIESGVVEDCFANLLLQCINPSTLFGFDYAV